MALHAIQQAAVHHDPVERLVLGRHTALVADPAMRQLYALARRLARADMPVTIHGETGSGKELVAMALHAFSRRAAGPFVALNCAAIPDSLAEAELFGHGRGAFTGAVAARTGLLEAAHGGTLFLDEIAELSPATQARLLRVLETAEVRRLGETAAHAIDVRVVCASLRRLRDEVTAGRFREDLFYRLGTAQLEVPALRDRPRDLAVLGASFVAAACASLGRPTLALSPATLAALAARPWHGNVRELRHVLDYAVATAPDDAVDLLPAHLPPAAPPPAGAPTRFRRIADELAELERTRMVEALRATGGVQFKAAALIGMPMRTFATKLRRYAIEP